MPAVRSDPRRSAAAVHLHLQVRVARSVDEVPPAQQAAWRALWRWLLAPAAAPAGEARACHTVHSIAQHFTVSQPNRRDSVRVHVHAPRPAEEARDAEGEEERDAARTC
jgi:hypothetical protein